MKNKCAPESLDPTHFRNFLVICQFKCGQMSIFAEVQVHHAAVLAHNEAPHAHDHYEYFRAKLCNKYQEQLDEMLERMLTFLDEIHGVPVLLSMLVLILKHMDADAVKELPMTSLQLYKEAAKYAVREALSGSTKSVEDTMRMLRHLAMKNHLERRRIFSASDVYRMLVSEDVDIWTFLDIGTNLFGSVGAKAKAHALEKNSTLTEIRLEGNAIDTCGTKALAKALMKNLTVIRFSIGRNKKDQCVQSIIEAIDRNVAYTVQIKGVPSWALVP